MTSYIAPPPPGYGLGECDFVSRARSFYTLGDDIVRSLQNQRKCPPSTRRTFINAIRTNIANIENEVWQALQRDYPMFRYRRQNQTIVINYYSGGPEVYVNPGEIYKIKAWGHNEYYEALDTINRLQNKMWNDLILLDRRWGDDWKRLGKHLNTIYERNCRGTREFNPGVIVTLPPNVPSPPNPPGPEIICWPPLPVPSYGMWNEGDTRNWSVTGWSMGGSTIPGISGTMVVNAPQIIMIDGREFVYYTPSSRPSKLVWLFHGAGGSARNWFTNYESVKYIKKFLDAGYAVCAYDSYNRVSKKWAPTSNYTTNREIVGLKACQEHLANVGILRKVCTSVAFTNPITGIATASETCGYVGVTQYGVGMSAGGGFVSYAAVALGFRKIAIHNASGYTASFQNANYASDTLWMVSANDSVIDNNTANQLYSYLQTNKPTLTTAYYTQAGTKITSAIFDAIPNISTLVANAIVTGLLAEGFIDNTGALTTKYSSATLAMRKSYLQDTIPTIVSQAFVADQNTYRKYVNDIIDQIKISFSDHEFSGWQRTEAGNNLVLTDRDLAFFNA